MFCFNLTPNCKFICFLYQIVYFDRMQLSKLNPDWNFAQMHGLSTFPGIVDPNSESKNRICPCCLNSTEKQKASLCENSKELQFLGFGFPLFYVFIKYCIILLLVDVCSYNAMEMYWAINENMERCHELEHGCTSFMVRFARIIEKVDNAEIVTRVFAFVLHLAVLLYIRDLMAKTRSYYDERTCSLSDYSILLKNLPPKKGTRAKLVNLLSNRLGKSYKVHEFTFLPGYQQFYRMEDEINEVIQRIKKAIGLEQTVENKLHLQQLNKQLQAKQKELQQYCDRQLQLQARDECVSEKVIFSCTSQDEKEQIMERFKQLTEQQVKLAFELGEKEQCKIMMGEAPEPKEINWQHINYPEQKRLGRMILGWIATILFLATITVIFFFLLSEKSLLIEHSLEDTAHKSASTYNFAIALVYLALLSVILFNKFVMGWVLHKICDFQRHETTAEEEFHFALKYSVGMFFTTALMTLAVQDLKFHNFYESSYGVVEQETIMFMMNAIFVPFIWLINPWHLVVLIRRKINWGRKDLTQKQANKIMENVQYNMGKRYAEIIEVMWFTYLYDSLIPFGACLSLLGLSLYYWVDKYNLLRRSSVNSNIAGQLSLFSMKLLDFTLLFKPLGQIIFDYQIRHEVCKSSIIMAVIAFIYLLLPIDSILECIHPEKFKNEVRTFAEVSKNFKETYQTLHPIFSMKKENRQKIYTAFNLIGHIIANNNNTAAEQEINPVVQVQSMNEEHSAQSINVFQAAFNRNNKVTPIKLDKLDS